MRFERGTDPRLPVHGAGARVRAARADRRRHGARGTIVDRLSDARSSRRVLHAAARQDLAGCSASTVPDADVRRILDSLGFALRDAPDGWDVTVPTRRVDVLREVDLIEEIARHHGFDRIPVTLPRAASPRRRRSTRASRGRGSFAAVMTGAGFSEAVTFGFIGEAAAAPFAADGDLVPIANPLSENFAVLRPSALPGLRRRRRAQPPSRAARRAAVRNRRTASRGAAASAARSPAPGPATAAATTGAAARATVDFFDMKGVVRADLRRAAASTCATEPQREPGWCRAEPRPCSSTATRDRDARAARAGGRRSARLAGRRRRLRRRDRSRRRRARSPADGDPRSSRFRDTRR